MSPLLDQIKREQDAARRRDLRVINRRIAEKEAQLIGLCQARDEMLDAHPGMDDAAVDRMLDDLAADPTAEDALALRLEQDASEPGRDYME